MPYLSDRPRSKLKLLIAVVLLVVLPLFFIGGPDWSSDPLFRSMWNLGHILFFGLLTLAVRLHCGPGGWRQWLGLSSGVLVASLAIEYVQSFLDRQLDWEDIQRNLIGVWLVLAWGQPAGASRKMRPVVHCAGVWCIRVLATALLGIQLSTVADVALQQYGISQQLPLLSDLNDPEVLKHWSGDLELSHRHSPGSRFSLAINLTTTRYSGVSLNNMPNDWHGYKQLSLHLFNPETTPLPLTLRIHDLQHERGSNAYADRFNTRLLVDPGWNHYEIDLSEVRQAPAGRTMDMTRIRRLGLFTSNLEAPRKVFLADLRLE